MAAIAVGNHVVSAAGDIGVMRYGQPMWKPRRETRCFLTIETGDTVMVRLWRGKSLASIKRVARKHYGPDAVIQAGMPFWVTL
jgi:hypothetical protein